MFIFCCFEQDATASTHYSKLFLSTARLHYKSICTNSVNYNHFLNVICCQFPHYFEHICVQRYKFVFNVLCIIFIAVAPSGYCISRVTIACRTVSEFVGVIVLCFYKQITSFSLDQANIWITLFCFLCVVLTTFGLL